MINTERTPDMIPEFSLEYIGSTPYLVPYGQAVSCGAKAVKLNPTGAVMWESYVMPYPHALVTSVLIRCPWI